MEFVDGVTRLDMMKKGDALRVMCCVWCVWMWIGVCGSICISEQVHAGTFVCVCVSECVCECA